ncbi:MAG TPA: type II toxin-antitoxin system PemK/MazF family toxin [Pyrinomonadaceae bacterium]|jgi:mRNA interferase MazF|nr:type II toxin-antitoxin system PemK/MazF family toxin [Pyrinomonadaceae bacterium]
MTKVTNSGDVVVLDFPGVTGTKRRPAVVVSSAAYPEERPDVVVGLITSQTTDAVAATDYLLQDWAAANLRKASAFRSFFVTIPRLAITAHIGQLSAFDWKAVRE